MSGGFDEAGFGLVRAVALRSARGLLAYNVSRSAILV